MGTPLSLFTGMWFSLFGGAVLWWCAVEVRLRRVLRRAGIGGMARVVAASAFETAGEPLDEHADAATEGAATDGTVTGARHGRGPDRRPTRPPAATGAGDYPRTFDASRAAVAVPAATEAEAEAETDADPDNDIDRHPETDRTGHDLDNADNAPLLRFEAEGHGEVITRPRGWTSIRRSAALPVGALVPVFYDPRQPTRVALEGVPHSRSDLFWILLGLAFAGCGVMLLASAF